MLHHGGDAAPPTSTPHRGPVYSTCLFCHSPLGENEVVERFPIGRRLAFDAAKGRLWVICRKCARWNLTPLEERWEAIEFSVGRSQLKDDVLPLHVVELAQTLPECLDAGRVSGKRLTC